MTSSSNSISMQQENTIFKVTFQILFINLRNPNIVPHSFNSFNIQPPPPSDSSTNSSFPELPPPLDFKTPKPSQGVAVLYKIPTWSAAPCHQFYLEVLKDGSIIDKFNVHEKGAYMFGRLDLCDFVLEHPTISRFHAARNGIVDFVLAVECKF
ncbi:hypothetical protein P8452_32408 [Trifolium repens]|nr:hypothetical protein P8452_32408 [Trifolium repens]